MTDSIFCGEHGRSAPRFVCQHLVTGKDLGFFYSDDPGNPRPDAWCQACDEVLVRVGEWNDESEAFAGIKVICSGCYDAAKRRNCNRRFTFRCDSCSKTHEGVPGYGWSYPTQYLDITEAERPRRAILTSDTCVIDGRRFFVRGTLDIPVVDASESLVFGAWVSLSGEDFERYRALRNDPARTMEPPMAGWLCSSIPGYPDTLSVKARIWMRAPGLQPAIELEPTDHPLAVQQREGINTQVLTQIYERVSPGRFTAV